MMDSAGFTFLLMLMNTIGGLNRAIGLIIIKCSNKDFNADHQVNKTRFLAGLLYMLAGDITFAATLAYIDLVIVTGTSAINICLVIIISVVVLGEPYDLKRDTIGIALILTGSFMILFFGHKGSDNYTLDELKALLGRPDAIAYQSMVGILMVIAMCALFFLIRALNLLSKFLSREDQLELLKGKQEQGGKARTYRALVEFLESITRLEPVRQEALTEWEPLRKSLKVPMVLLVLFETSVVGATSAYVKLF